MKEVNNFNINNIRKPYSANVKKDECKDSTCKFDEADLSNIADGSIATESYGRALVKHAGSPSSELVQSVKDSMDFFMNNPELVSKSMKACDDLHELLEADDVDHAYEQACCISCDNLCN